MQTPALQMPTYDYLVRFISCNRKSKYVTRIWHEVHDVFESPPELKKKLVEDFPDKLVTSLALHLR